MPRTGQRRSGSEALRYDAFAWAQLALNDAGYTALTTLLTRRARVSSSSATVG
jgi:hypothetical protein